MKDENVSYDLKRFYLRVYCRCTNIRWYKKRYIKVNPLNLLHMYGAVL